MSFTIVKCETTRLERSSKTTPWARASRETFVQYMPYQWYRNMIGASEEHFWRSISARTVWSDTYTSVTSPDYLSRREERYSFINADKAEANAGYREAQAIRASREVQRLMMKVDTAPGHTVVVVGTEGTAALLELETMRWVG